MCFMHRKQRFVGDFMKVMELDMELRGFEASITSIHRNKTSNTFEEPVANPKITLKIFA